MQRQKELNNQGFSLIELIIVIAIMAILIGIIAPNLLRYVERTRISADYQLCESVRTAVTLALTDPLVPANEISSYKTRHIAGVPLSPETDRGNEYSKGLASCPTMFAIMNEILGIDGTAIANIMASDSDLTTTMAIDALLLERIKSSHSTASYILVEVTATNEVKVSISQTDSTGGGDTSYAAAGGSAHPNIMVP